jgi:hypothetical protein
MKTNRVLRIQLFALLIVAAALLAACKPRDGGSNPREGIDIIPLVNASHIAINSANTVDCQVLLLPKLAIGHTFGLADQALHHDGISSQSDRDKFPTSWELI